MDDLRTRAHLVDRRAGGIGAVFTREELEEAATATEFPATLLLDLDRVERDGGTTQARVAVDWDQATLEQLLASTQDQEIELWFDERRLAMAFDDVEGHGVREKAAVLAVAVVAAGASATPAFARVAADVGGGASATPTAAVPSPAADKHAVLQGAQRALQQDTELSQNLSTQATGIAAPNPVGDKGAVLAGHERALQQDEKVSQGMGSIDAAVASTTDGSTLSVAEVAGAAAGGLLLIAAAGFGVARKRTPPAQPA